MREIVAYVTANPGCTKLAAGKHDSVQRAVRGGYIREEQDHPTAHYRLFVTEAGRALARKGQ
jgi:hypothetical protein